MTDSKQKANKRRGALAYVRNKLKFVHSAAAQEHIEMDIRWVREYKILLWAGKNAWDIWKVELVNMHITKWYHANRGWL